MKFKKKSKSMNTLTAGEFEDNDVPKKWHEELIADPKTFAKCTEQTLIELKEEAKNCNDAEVKNFNIKKSKTSSDYQWMKTMLSKGTVGDKIAAHTVLIQENPVCNLENIRNLVGMVKVGKKKECMEVMGTLVELFLSDLLRPSKKLKPFYQRPLSLINELSSGNAVTRRRILSTWYFEDQLKEMYTSFVLALNTIAHDTVDSNKEKAITAMYRLLEGNPEQEQNLLSYIVNKLGDPSQKVASKVIYCLTQLLFKHINMQGVVLNEVEKLLFRPNISTRAQYYSLCFLSQYHLSHEAKEVARKLIEVYFAFFKACVKKGDVDSRMMSALLMGINRAYPYAKTEFSKISDHIDTMYRLVHLASFNTSLQALILLHQVSDSEDNNRTRFYSALYRKLLDPNILITTNKAMLLSLVYKALLKDKELGRIKSFIKRLLQIALLVEPSFACGILYLISQLTNKNSALLAIVSTQTVFEDDDTEEKYFDANLDIDPNAVEIKQEVEDEDPRLQSNDSEILNNSTPVEIKEEDVKPDSETLDAPTNGSWYHCETGMSKKNTCYNPMARNPLYGGGENCNYIELIYLTNHHHPTVSLFAKNILESETVKYTGDPINDFTMIRFLERFVFKNPKKIEETAGKYHTFAKRKLNRPIGVKLLPVNSSSYLNEEEKNIPVDELFLYSYLRGRQTAKGSKDHDDDSDIESVQSEEFEEMLDKMSSVKDVNEDIDYMDEIGNSLKIRDKKKKKGDADVNESENELSDEDEDFEDDFDGEMDEEDEELIEGLDDDDEDIDFNDDGGESVKSIKKIKKKTDDMSSLFASADEFATMLDDEGSSKVKPGGSNSFSNKDNAHSKQLNWEANRNRWINSFNKAVGGNKNRKSKHFNKKRSSNSKGGNKNKRFKT